jgi:hypothetical protein
MKEKPVQPDRLVRIAIASDLHAYAIDPDKPSHLNVRDSAVYPGQHPITGLIKLINDEKITADALLCPGDMGDKACPEGVTYAWSALHQVKAALGAKILAATAGNHDIDSRYKGDDHDPEHILKSLSPQFPLDDETLNDRYWARAYVVTDSMGFRLALLNSSAYHGNTPTEKNHGRIDRKTLGDFEKDIRGRTPAVINVLLCHHHPQVHSELDLGVDDVMKQGQLLLDFLGTADVGRWLVIHGHKHHPKISYAAGGASSPVVFAAGSLCANLFLTLQNRVRNQFYLITLSTEEISKAGMVGRVQSWDWANGIGWSRAGDSSGLPALFGFGCREDAMVLASKVSTFVKNGVKDWPAVQKRVPELEFLLPQDWNMLRSILTKDHSIEILDVNGIPKQAGKKQ